MIADNELISILKNKLKEYINPEIYNVNDIKIKGNGFVLKAEYYYVPIDKPEIVEIVIKDISEKFDKDNIFFIFKKDEK